MSIEIFRQPLGTASSKSTTSLTLSGLTVAAGAAIVLDLLMNEPGIVLSVAAGAQAFSLDGNGIIIVDGSHTLLRYYLLDAAAISSGSIVVTFDILSVAAIVATAYHRVAAAARDGTGSANGSGVDALCLGLTTSRSNEAIHACVGVVGPAGDGAPTWISSETAGQSVGTTGGAATSNVSLYEGFREVVEIGTYGCAATLQVSRDWGAVVTGLKASQGATTQRVTLLAGQDLALLRVRA